MQENKTKHIAKNTAVLYFRLIFVMIISLYTVRVVLDTLGIVDYGIYNVVAGIVTILSFLSATMASACQRFFAFELGKENFAVLKKTFASSLTIFVIIGGIVFLLLETVGVWFLNNKMIIPANRIDAANWIYQFAIISFLFTIITSPYNAAIIAHEDMTIYAYISIIEVALKLVVVFILSYSFSDKLVVYGFLVLGATIVTSLSYIFVCIRKYKECRTLFMWDKIILYPMASYATWNMIGAIANIMKLNGTNILLNVFFGPVVNSARAISMQVNMTFNSFVTNFYMAVRPQITKAYAAGERDYFMMLIFKSAKASYFLLLILSIPLLLETNFILNLWLKEVPQYTVIFTQLLIINILLESINNQLVAALQAAGRIKTYQIFISTVQILVLPISYVLFYWGALPIVTLYVSIAITILSFIPQIWIVHKVVGLSITDYLKQVVLVVSFVSLLSYIPPLLVYLSMEPSWSRFSLVCIIGSISCLGSIAYIGFSKEERKTVIILIKNKLNKKH
ncbi:lipopolysaccharide biosynthesis protein [Dysgonomonas capnocytophagoides]|uniref:Lipopolysaccharide biosynthesis protein n=1 Tax=Dysgonomonas capnocytophagoides TaxID=45254 RepID=A0A4Y8KZN0_9BACT|nr:oligosaccharide flippase family protein [Dysgonomonas capnocytophagoides]TFD93183.1 lipopolysaccharide biosynthesis protein [Dysgonomonas capnocytophagoides]